MAATSSSTEPPNKTASSSIYLDCEDGERGKKKSARRTKDQPPKRLTMAQRATLEALETFGGSGLSALAVRKVDLRAQLKEEERIWRKREGQEEEVDEGLPPAKKTRLQASKERVDSEFDGIQLGSTLAATTTQPATSDTAPASETKNEDAPAKNEDAPANPPRRLTRVERAQLEAMKTFGGEALDVVMGGAKWRVARTLEKAVPSKEEEIDEEKATTDQEESSDHVVSSTVPQSDIQDENQEIIDTELKDHDGKEPIENSSSDDCVGRNQSATTYDSPNITYKDAITKGVNKSRLSPDDLTSPSGAVVTCPPEPASLNRVGRPQLGGGHSDELEDVCEADSTMADSFASSDKPADITATLSPAE